MPEQDTPPSSVGLDLKAVIARQEIVLQHQLDWIRAVDGKTPLVIGLATTMLAVIGALSPPPSTITWVAGFFMTVGTLPLLVCVACCAAATFPQTTGPKGSMIFFGGISSMSPSAYLQKIANLSDGEYLDDLNRQCHRNAQIAHVKYRAVRKAMGWLFVGTPLWLIACYFLFKG